MKLSKMACIAALLSLPFAGLVRGAEVDLWDNWRQGFEKYEAAEKELKERDLDEALKLYRESQQIFLKIRKASPEWNKEVVSYRLSLCLRKINAIERPRKEAAEAARRQSDMDKLKAEVDTLNKQLRQTRVELIDAKSAAERNALSEKQVKKLMDENTELSKKIAVKDASIASLKSDLKKANRAAEEKRQLLKVKTDLEKANQQIQRLRKRMEELQTRVDKYYDQRLAAEDKVSKLEDQVRNFDAEKKKTEALSAENRKLAESLASVARSIKEKEENLASLQAKNKQLEEKIAALENGKTVLPSVQNLQKELADARRKAEYLQTLSTKQKHDLDNLNIELGKKSAELNKVVLDLVKSTESQARLRTEQTALQKNLDEQKKLAETAKVLAVENALLKKNVEEIAQKYEDLNKGKNAVSETSAMEIARLKKELEAAMERCRTAEKSIAEFKKASVNNEALAKMKADLAASQQKTAAAAAEAGNVKQALAQLTQKYEALQKAYEDVKAKELANLKIMAEKLPENEKNTEKIKSLVAQIEQISGERTQLQQKIAQLEKVQQEYEKLKNTKPASVTVKVPDPELKKELEALKAINRNLENSLVVAKNDAKAKLSSYEADTVAMKNSLEVLKKQLISAQTSEEKVKKDLALLKLEYADLEKKIANSVSSDELKLSEAQREKLKKDLDALRLAKTEADAALKQAEELIRTQKKRLELYAKEIDPTAKDRIAKLTAAVTELQEAKLQYENTIRNLKAKQEMFTEDNKALKLANTALQNQVAELKVKPEEYLRQANDLLQKNIKLQETVQKNAKQLELLTTGKQLDQSEIARLNKELQTVRTLADRYRKELTDWDELPTTDSYVDLKKKEEAINALVQENKDLREERDGLNTELTIAKDQAVKYKQLSKDIETNLRMSRNIVAKLKTILARHTSGAEVEKLIAEEFQKEKTVVAATLPEAETKLSPEEEKKVAEKLAADKKEYEKILAEGKTAEAEKRHDDALIAYWRASDLANGDPEAAMGLARIYLDRKDLNNAAKHYRIAVEDCKMARNPEFEDMLKKLQTKLEIEKSMRSVQVYLDNKSGEEALKAYKAALGFGMKRDMEIEKKLKELLKSDLDLEDVLSKAKKAESEGK